MRVNPTQHSDAVSPYMNSAAKAAADTEAARRVDRDSVELSSGAREYAQLIKAARESLEASETSDDLRAKNIAAEIQSGSYQVSAENAAQSILGTLGIDIQG